MVILQHSLGAVFALGLLLSLLCSVAMAEETVMVPMRDGVELTTKVWKPGDGSYPVVLTRAYWPGFGEDHVRFNAAGYVYVGQATRGGGGADGTRFFNDGPDGYDALDWVSRQPWCNGRIAMYGKSYWGITQWLAALEGHPNLKAIIPQNCNADAWQYGYRANGAVTLAMCAKGRAYKDVTDPQKYGWEKFYRFLPLIDLDKEVSGREDPLWRAYITHSSFDNYWRPISMRADGADGKYKRIRIPVYVMGGWYDYYPGAAFASFQRLREAGLTHDLRINISATDHLTRVPGERPLPGGGKDEVALAIRWLDWVLTGSDNGMKDEPPVKFFVMGANEWRAENEWPPAGARFTNYYFHSTGGSRLGTLSTTPPGDEQSTEYTYDPDNPVRTLGGGHSFLGTDHPELIRVGSYDHRPNEDRDDVLVFTSDAMTQDTAVIGPVVIKLHAASSALDTDFCAILLDVYPDGRAYNLCEGIIRARFRESVWEPPKLLSPGEIYEYTLELQPTANVFKRGHCIRVHLTSSNWPLWDRNPNTGHEIGMDAQMQPARQTIYHDRRHPSHIVLPVLPPAER